jgi:hypothetical protein
VLRVKRNCCCEHGRGSGNIEFARSEEAKEVLVGEVGGGSRRLRFQSRQRWTRRQGIEPALDQRWWYTPELTGFLGVIQVANETGRD